MIRIVIDKMAIIRNLLKFLNASPCTSSFSLYHYKFSLLFNISLVIIYSPININLFKKFIVMTQENSIPLLFVKRDCNKDCFKFFLIN